MNKTERNKIIERFLGRGAIGALQALYRQDTLLGFIAVNVNDVPLMRAMGPTLKESEWALLTAPLASVRVFEPVYSDETLKHTKLDPAWEIYKVMSDGRLILDRVQLGAYTKASETSHDPQSINSRRL
jgi:hypothetical protein